MKMMLFKEKKFKLQILWLIVKFIECMNFQCAKLFGQRHAKMSVKKINFTKPEIISRAWFNLEVVLT